MTRLGWKCLASVNLAFKMTLIKEGNPSDLSEIIIYHNVLNNAPSQIIQSAHT